ncbi:reverse transcriptase domain-containing protein [Tanacetum coccineum]
MGFRFEEIESLGKGSQAKRSGKERKRKVREGEVEGYLVRRVYMDEGASIEVMFEHCFENLSPLIKARLKETQTDLVGFAGEKKQVIDNETEEGEKEGSDAKEVSVTEEVLVNPTFPDQLVIIEGGLSETCKSQLKLILKANWDIFAWELVDMTGIGRNLEAYVDDMVIKSNDEKMLLADVVETFDNLRKINMKLNPKKCSFGVEEGKFLGYMVTSEGIRENPKKTRALADL